MDPLVAQAYKELEEESRASSRGINIAPKPGNTFKRKRPKLDDDELELIPIISDSE
jgi:hypothetical protein